MKLLRILGTALACIVVFLAAPRGARASCDSGLLIDAQMNWCAKDRGFNEGAVCGLDALAAAGVQGLPGLAAAGLLGNTWDRAAMIAAARAAFRAGQREAAITAALCCQIHNPDYPRLRECRAEVGSWLAR